MNESSSSSSSARHDFDVSFDVDLIAAARRTRFIAPPGRSAQDCWDRIDELLHQEASREGSVRIGDLLVLTNAWLSNRVDSSLSSADLVALVQSRVGQRARLPNTFTLIQYLRFIQLSGSVPVSVPALALTVDILPQLKVSELIEIASLILRKEFLSGCQEESILDLVRAVRERLDSTDDPESVSEKNRANAMRFSERFFSDYKYFRISSELSRECVRLMLTVTRNRNCASAVSLESLTSMGIEASESGDLEFGREISHHIRDHQLTRLFAVKSLFKSQPDFISRLRTLGDLTRTDLTPKESNMFRPKSESNIDRSLLHVSGEKVMFGSHTYSRLAADVNGVPSFSNGLFSLYYAPCTGCWQIGPDPARQFVRTAFVQGEPGLVPLSATGWTVYSKRKSCYVPSENVLERAAERVSRPARSVDIGLSAADVVPTDDTTTVANDLQEERNDEATGTVMSKWSALALQGDKPAPVEARSDKLSELEQAVADLQKQVDQLHRITSQPSHPSSSESMVGRAPPPPRQESMVDKVKALGRSVTAAIDSLGTGGEMVRVGLVSRSFEEARAEELTLARLGRQQKIIARKLRS